MQVTVQRITDWQLVADAARMTIHKGSLDKEPSDKFKREIIMSQHSPIRLLEFKITVTDVPYYTIGHFVRHHIGIEKFVASQRDDRFPAEMPRAERPQGALVNAMFVCNAESLINISRKRLCHQADENTTKLWEMVVDQIISIEPIVADFLVPECVYRGGRCPEMKCCGFCFSKKAQMMTDRYWENSRWYEMQKRKP